MAQTEICQSGEEAMKDARSDLELGKKGEGVLAGRKNKAKLVGDKPTEQK